MPKRISKLANSLKQLGEIQVTDWDFMELLNTDVKKLEITRSLRKLGAVHVLDWDFRTVLPAVKKTAAREIDVIGLFKQAAGYKVLEWDLRSALPFANKSEPQDSSESSKMDSCPPAMQAMIRRLENFLLYMIANLTDEPDHARIKVTQIAPDVLCFKLVLVKRDVAMLIGREGFTASAIRRILKAVAGMNGIQALLQIHSHEEEMADVAKQ